MRNNKEYIPIILLNLFLSLLVVYVSPRFDVITFGCFLAVNVIIFVLLLLREKKQNEKIKDKIDELTSLLHSIDANFEDYEILDDEFGALRDEIIKIIGENNTITNNALKDKQILKEYTEDIAHQLKTPLTGIMLMLDLMEEDSENMKEYIYRIRRSVNRLHQLVDILLKLAALDSGTISMKKESINVKEIVSTAISEMEMLFADYHSTIPIYGNDYKLICDRKWTYEAIFNILKNAMEASKDKGVAVRLKETNIYQSILIEDYSKGMSEETLKNVYKRFHKGNKDSKGYGIGLPMAKTIIEKQGGELIYFRGKEFNYFELRFYR
ncbi:Two component system histidine kinase [Lachnospiraceae bacterium TWA4]|nr:Two component system histidine kinase [Lachnospiraceae bacterium TWA4]